VNSITSILWICSGLGLGEETIIIGEFDHKHFMDLLRIGVR
jgi:hypothetical protein